MLTAILLRHPVLLHDIEEAYAGLALSAPLDRLRNAIMHMEDVGTLDSEAVVAHLNASGLGADTALVLSDAMPLPSSARRDAMPAEAEEEWWHLFGLMRGLSRLNEEVAQAAQAYAEQQTEAAERRLVGLVNARLELVAIDADE